MTSRPPGDDDGTAAAGDTDAEDGGVEDDGDEVPPAGFDAWRRRSAAGEVGTAIARGLAAVFAPTQNTPVISAPIPGDPPDSDRGFRVVLDPDDPAKSVALFTQTGEAGDDPESGHDGPTGQPGDPGHPDDPKD